MPLRRMIDFDRATHLPFSIFTVRQDAEEAARANAAGETDGWRYKVVARPSGFVVEMYDAANLYLGAL